MDTKEKLARIKKVMKHNIGKEVILKIKNGKRDVTIQRGTIKNVFSSFFTVDVTMEDNSNRVQSYSYFDILTSIVHLQGAN